MERIHELLRCLRDGEDKRLEKARKARHDSAFTTVLQREGRPDRRQV